MVTVVCRRCRVRMVSTGFESRMRHAASSGALWLVMLPALLGSPSVAAAGELADAAEVADWSEVERLLHQSVDPNAVQVDGMTALHWASYHDHFATARLLLDAGADPKSGVIG